MSTAAISQNPNYIGKRNNFKRPGRLLSSVIDSGSDCDSFFDNSYSSSPPRCALCCVSSHLGQGELIRYAPSAGFDPFQQSSDRSSRSPKTPRRSTRSGTKRALSVHSEDGLSKIGRADILEPAHVFESTGHVFAHHCCAAWSEGVATARGSFEETTNSRSAKKIHSLHSEFARNVTLVGVDRAVFSSLSQKCSYCQNYGASVRCKVSNCSSFYHYPCAVASGAFQDAASCSVLCAPEHRHQARLIDPSGCEFCSQVGELSDLLFCTTCGAHSHARCLNEGIIVTGEVRAGWQCYTCKICQQCRKSDDDAQMIICETCDKGWHTYCLNPVMDSVPKDGWSCTNCRNCIECGNKIRNGQLIPTNTHSLAKEKLLCTNCKNHRLNITEYEDEDDEPIIKCAECGARCHPACDSDSALFGSYQCPKCHARPFDIANVKSNQSSKSDSCFTDEISAKESIDSDLAKSEIMDVDNVSPRPFYSNETAESLGPKEEALISSNDQINTLRSTAGAIGNAKNAPSESPKSHEKASSKVSNKPANNKPTKKSQKKGARKGTKMKKDQRQKNGANGEHENQQGSGASAQKRNKRKAIDSAKAGVEIQSAGAGNRDTTFDEFRCVLLTDTEADEFARSSDLCATCGAIGDRDHFESKMLFCIVCAQSYHVYCAEVTLSKELLDRGWTCPHCRICPKCDETVQPADSAASTCCQCYQTFHQSCLSRKPIVETLPESSNLQSDDRAAPKNKPPSNVWKCSDCIKCNTCGTTSLNNPKLEWQNDYSTCPVCWSKQACSVCNKDYKEDDVLLKCSECLRWQHALHEQVYSESDADSMAEQNFKCTLCRPPKKSYKPLRVQNSNEIIIDTFNWSKEHDLQKTHEKDGVSFTDEGIQTFQKELSRLIGSMRKPRTPSLKNSMNPSEPPSPTHPEIEDEPKDQNPALTNGEQPRKRKPYRPGIGGFLVRTRNRVAKPKAVVESSGNPSDSDNPAKIESKKQNKKKKSKIIDNYPQYIQEAFFGQLAHDSKMCDLVNIKTEPADSFAASGPSQVVIKSEPLDVYSAETDSQSTADNMNELLTPIEDTSLIILDQPLPEMTESSGANDPDIFFDLTNFEKDFDDVIDMSQIINDIKSEEDQKPEDTPTSSASITSKEKHVGNGSAVLGSAGGTVSSPRPALPGQHMSAPVGGNVGINRVIPNGIMASNVPPEGRHITSPMPSPVIYQPPQIVAQPLGSTQQVVQVTQSHHGHISPQIQVRQVMSEQIRPRIHPPNYQQTYMPMNNHGLQRQMTVPIGAGHGPPPPHGHIPNHVQQMQNWNGTRDQLQKNQNEPSSSSNRNNSEKWREDEARGDKATISPVLYANTMHPHLKTEFPDWNDRHKQIQRLWRKVPGEGRKSYLSKARENRDKKTGNKSSSRSRSSSLNKPKTPSDNSAEKTPEKESSDQAWKQFICASSPNSSAPSPTSKLAQSQSPAAASFSPNPSTPSHGQVSQSPVPSPQSESPAPPMTSADPMFNHMSPESGSPLIPRARKMSSELSSPHGPAQQVTQRSPMPPPAMSPSVGDVFPSPRLHNQPSLRFASTTHATSAASNSPPNSGLQAQQNTQQNIVQLQIRPNQQHHCERLFDNLGRQQSGSLTRENIMSKLQRKERMRLTEEASNQIWNTAAAQTGPQTMMYNQQGQPIPIGHRFPVQAGPGGSPAVQGPPGTPFNPIIQHRQPIVTRLIPNNQSVNQQVRFQQAQVISPQISHQQIICSDPIKINGAVQIELKNGNSSPSNGVVTVARAPLNHNYSNNHPVAAPESESSSSDKGAFSQSVESTPPPPQIPQIDGLNDSEDDVPAVTQRPPKPPAPKTPPFVVIPLGTTTTSPSTKGVGEKGPVKEISPKQKTIVATAKVHKPGSPASSPTNRQIRMSPSHTGTYRPVGLSPRAISPGRPLQQGQSGPTLIKLTQPVTLVVNTSVKVNSTSSSTLQKESALPDISAEEAASSRTPTVELPPPPKEENQNNEIEEAKKIIYNKLKQELGRQKKNMSTGRKTVQIKKKSDTLSSSPTGAQQGVSSPVTAQNRPRSKSGAGRGEDKQAELNKKKTFEVLRQIQSRKSPNGSLASFNGKTADIRVQMPHQTIQHNSASLPSPSSRAGNTDGNPSAQIQGIPIVVSSASESTANPKPKEKAAAPSEPAKAAPRARKPRPKKSKKNKDEPKVDIQAAQKYNQGTQNTFQPRLPVLGDMKALPSKKNASLLQANIPKGMSVTLPTTCSLPGTTNQGSSVATVSKDEMERQELLNNLLSAEELTITSPTTDPSARGTKVSEEQLKMLGISLKHPSNTANEKTRAESHSLESATNSQAQSAQAGVKLDPIASSQVFPNSGSVDVKVENSSQAPVQIKQEPKDPSAADKTGSEKLGELNKNSSRKRKKSLESKPQKKRKRDVDSSQYSAMSIQLGLTEAPVKVNIDPCVPLGGGTLGAIAKTTTESEESWTGHWASGGWSNTSASFYDVIVNFQNFTEMAQSDDVQKLLDLSSTFGQTKSFFSVSLTDEENSSDEESSIQDLSLTEMGNIGSLEEIAPRISHDFPVAPASPEVHERGVFTFLDKEGIFDSSSVAKERSCPSPELPMPSDTPRDPVTVTLTFRPDQAGQPGDKSNIENALKAISNIIGIKIEGYRVSQNGSPAQQHKTAVADAPIKEETRRCSKCGEHIIGEANKKPITSKQHPDSFYCTVSCRVIDQAFKEEASKLKINPSAGDKTQKVHAYKRRNYRICLADLIDSDTSVFCDELPDIAPQKISSRGRRQTSETHLVNFGRPLLHKNVLWNVWNNKFAPVPKISTADHGSNYRTLRLKYEQHFSKTTDKRSCILCKTRGDGKADTLGRLLNVGISKWVHVNCILWAADVREDSSGALINVDQGLSKCQPLTCASCSGFGASVTCARLRCDLAFHIECAFRSGGTFLRNRQFYCSAHLPKAYSSETLQSLACCRRLFIDGCDLDALYAPLCLSSPPVQLRVGSTTLFRLGRIDPAMQLLCDELKNLIAPIGLSWSRYFWTSPRERSSYNFCIWRNGSSAEFKVQTPKSSEFSTFNFDSPDLKSAIFDPTGLSFPKQAMTVAAFFLNFTAPQIQLLFQKMPLASYLAKKNTSGASEKLAQALAPEAKRHCPAHKKHSSKSQSHHNLNPKQNNVYLQASPIHEIGLFSSQTLEPGHVISELRTSSLKEQSDEESFSIRFDESSATTFIEDECGTPCRYVNHSATPNCEFRLLETNLAASELSLLTIASSNAKAALISIKLVKKDEEITVDYTRHLIASRKQRLQLFS